MEIRDTIKNASDEELLNQQEELEAEINNTDVSEVCAGEYNDLVRYAEEVEEELKRRA